MTEKFKIKWYYITGIVSILNSPAIIAQEDNETNIYKELSKSINSYYDEPVTGKKYIQLSSELKTSNNIAQAPTNEKSGYTSSTSADFNYHLEKNKNTLSMKYKSVYDTYSENDVDNELYWLGTTNIYQKVYYPQLYLSLSHQRNRYLLEPNSADLPSNQKDRDIITVNPIWTQTYSRKAGVEIGFAYQDVTYSHNKEQDSDRYNYNLAWFTKLNSKSEVRFISSYQDINFISGNSDYQQTSASIQVSGEFSRSSYLVQAGLSKVDQEIQTSNSPTALIKYSYKQDKYETGVILRKTLTDTSIGLALNSQNNGDLLNTTPKVIDRERIELYYKYDLASKRFSHLIKSYFDQENTQLTLDNTAQNGDNFQRGLSTKMTFKHTSMLSSSLLIDYRNTDHKSDDKHEQWRFDLTTSYQISKHFYISAGVNYSENNNLEQSSKSYNETRYKTKVTLKY